MTTTEKKVDGALEGIRELGKVVKMLTEYHFELEAHVAKRRAINAALVDRLTGGNGCRDDEYLTFKFQGLAAVALERLRNMPRPAV
jgi:hypothetical protein